MATNTPTSNLGQAQPCPVLFHGIPEVARRLGIGQTFTWALIRDKKLPTVRLGRRTLVSEEALQTFVASLTSQSR